MIPVVNSYRLVENLPNAVLLTSPDAGHGSLFQYRDSFSRQAAAFLSVTTNLRSTDTSPQDIFCHADDRYLRSHRDVF